MTDMWWPIVAQICEVNMLRSFLRYVLRPPAVAFTFADRNPRVIKLWRHRIFVSRARSDRGRMGSGTVPHGGGCRCRWWWEGRGIESRRLTAISVDCNDRAPRKTEC